MFGQLGVPDQPILYKPHLVPVNKFLDLKYIKFFNFSISKIDK